MTTGIQNQKERLSSIMKNTIEKTAMALQTSQNKEYIQCFLIDPFIKYIFSRLFPYILVGVSIFAGLFLFIASSIIFLIIKTYSWNNIRNTNVCPFCFRQDI